MANELSKTDEAAFAAMQREEEAPAPPPEPESEEETAPETESEDDAAADAVEGRGPHVKIVPHEALHEERSERRRLEVENRKLAEERALFEGRLQAVLGMREHGQRQAEPAAPEKPDIATDPIGVIQHLERQIEEIRAGGQQSAEERRQQAQIASLAQAAVADAQQFRAKTADYGDAYQFFRENRAAELQAYGVPADQIPAIIGQEELQIAHGAFQRQQSPAEVLYNVAKHRGYKPKAAPPAATEQIDRIAGGQERSRTLSSAGGGATETGMTAERLLKMSPAEFDAWTAKNPTKTKRLMGG